MTEKPMPTIDQMLCFAVYAAGHAFTRSSGSVHVAG